MISDRKLSANFNLHEYLISDTAIRHGLTSKQYNPPDFVISNIERLNKIIVQPFRNSVNKPLVILSGYRCKEVNDIIKGSANSEHMFGRAVDLYIPSLSNGLTFTLMKDFLNKNKIEYNQLIWEFGTKQNPAWVHVSIAESGSKGRKQILYIGV